MLSEKIKKLQFKFSLFKVKLLHMKKMKYNLKVLSFCIHHLDKLCVPTNEKENEVMKKLLSTYDETIIELNESVDIYRKRVTK